MRLEATSISVRFGGLAALDGASIIAQTGELTGLIGPNGAGKTTLFDVLAGYRAPNEGRVMFDGIDVTGHSAPRRARAGLGRTFQRMELFYSLTVRQNIALAAEAHLRATSPVRSPWVPGRRRRSPQVEELETSALEATDLVDVAESPARQLSLGQGRLLEMARCIARQPQLLLLDEPSSGLDSKESKRLGELLSSLVSNTGVGVLLVEHNMRLVLDICQRVSVLDFGRPLFEGTPDEVASSAAVRKAYLGE
jgi:ABC-type branched-subunit amino acid transport system ATPase component